MRDGDSTRIVMEQAMAGLFSRVRILSDLAREDDAWVDATEKVLREAWIDQLAYSQSLRESNRAHGERMKIMLEAVEDLSELAGFEDQGRAIRIVDALNAKLLEVGTDDGSGG